MRDRRKNKRAKLISHLEFIKTRAIKTIFILKNQIVKISNSIMKFDGCIVSVVQKEKSYQSGDKFSSKNESENIEIGSLINHTSHVIL